MLLEAGTDDMPEGVVVVRLAGRNISGVEVADLPYFTALQVLDLADNQVRCCCWLLLAAVTGATTVGLLL